MKKAELLERLQNIEKKRNFLMNVGLLDPEKERIQIPEVDDENIRRVLSVYVNDVEQKLGIYDELAEKINLLVELINSRFRYKEMQIDKETGFRFKTNQGVLLPANLSSGEQHELVLTYELLFQTSKNTLVLIDEPELSLHVGWQIRFLEDIQKVINLAQIDALVATHSPQIINNRWDLTVKLGGQKK
jgi:predicted ATP-binding protein involved in virulence